MHSIDRISISNGKHFNIIK